MGVYKVAGRPTNRKVQPADVADEHEENAALCKGEGDVPKILPVKSNDGLQSFDTLGRKHGCTASVIGLTLLVVCAIAATSAGSSSSPSRSQPSSINSVADARHQSRFEPPLMQEVPPVAGPSAWVTTDGGPEHSVRVGYPPEQTPTEPQAASSAEVEVGHPPEHTRTEPPTAKSTEIEVGHPPEHTLTEPPTAVRAAVPVGHPPEHTQTEPPAAMQAEVEVGHPPERTRTEPPTAMEVGHPAEHTRTMPPTSEQSHASMGTPLHSRTLTLQQDCTYQGSYLCPARTLFKNDEVLGAATTSIMAVGKRFLAPSDRQMVHDIITTSFTNISIELGTRTPAVAFELDMLQLDDTQKDAVVKLLQLVSDPRVQALGVEVARAIQYSSASDKESVRSQIEKRLLQHVPTMRQLRDEVVPKPLQVLWGAGHQWEMTLDPENVRAMQSSAGHLASDFVPSAAVDLMQKDAGIMGGVMEEARVLIDAIKLCTRSYGKELEVPAAATSTVGHVSDRLLACQAEDVMFGEVDFMKAIFCPLKFGTQGLDALRAIDTLQEAFRSSVITSQPSGPPAVHTRAGTVTFSQTALQSEGNGHKDSSLKLSADMLEPFAVAHPAQDGSLKPPADMLEPFAVAHSAQAMAEAPITENQPPKHNEREQPTKKSVTKAVPIGHPAEHTGVASSEAMPGCNFGVSPTCVASQLFEDRDLIDTATETLMLVGRKFLQPADRKAIRDIMASSFRNISVQLQKHAPDVAHELDALKVSKPHKNAVVASLWIISDPRVQQVGFDVAQAIHESYIADPEFLQLKIETRLRPEIKKIIKLRDDVVPEQLFRLWGKGHQWGMTLDADNVRAMETLNGKLVFAADSEAPGDLEQKSYAILGGVMEAGRALVDVIELCTRSLGKELRIPSWATSLTGRVDPDFLRCEVDSSKQTSLDFMKVLYCPLKFGTQGMDAMRAASGIAEKRP